MRKQHAVISDSWGNTTVLCAKHQVPMELTEVRRQMEYDCPHCQNKMNINDFNKMIDHLNDLIVEAVMEDREVILTNYYWKDRNGIEFKVLKHEDGKFEIEVWNKKQAGKKTEGKQ